MYLSTSVLLKLSVLAAFAIAQPVIEDRSDQWCTIHVIQYQKNEPIGDEPNRSEYVLETCVYDGAQNLLNIPSISGTSQCWIRDPALEGIAYTIPSQQPSIHIVYVTVGAVDDDPILFAYGDQHWGSNDQAHHSNFGGYEGGKREGDTGFSC